MAIVEISIVPLGTATPSVSRFVAKALMVLEKSGLNYKLTPMGTIIEGNLDKIFEVIRQMHEVPFKEGIERVVTTIKIDDRRDKVATMEKKLKSVEEKLKR